MTTLYDLAGQREAIDAAILLAEGELTPEMEAALDALDGSIEQKIEAVALRVREIRADASAAGLESERLTRRQVAFKRDADSLTDYLMRQMDRLGKTKVAGVRATVSTVRNPPKVVVGTLPDGWYDKWPTFATYVPEQVTPETYTLDKDAVKAAYKAGQEIPVGLTVEQGIRLEIK